MIVTTAGIGIAKAEAQRATMSEIYAERFSKRFQLRRDVFLINAPDGTGWLLDLKGSFFALNPTAIRLLRAALTADEEAVERLAAVGGVSRERVRADQAALVAQLLGRGLLSASPHTDQSPFPRWATFLLSITVGKRPTIRHMARLLPLSWLLFKRIGWQRTVTLIRQYVHPLTQPVSARFDKELVSTIRDAVAACRVWVGCKERAITAAAVAWAAGRPAKVVLGVSPFPLASHAWCEVDGRVITDPPDRVEPFFRVAEYA